MSELNLQHADCLVKNSNFTESVMTNICTGEIIYVPYGSLNYMFNILLAISILTLLFIISFLTIKILTDT